MLPLAGRPRDAYPASQAVSRYEASDSGKLQIFCIYTTYCSTVSRRTAMIFLFACIFQLCCLGNCSQPSLLNLQMVEYACRLKVVSCKYFVFIFLIRRPIQSCYAIITTMIIFSIAAACQPDSLSQVNVLASSITLAASRNARKGCGKQCAFIEPILYIILFDCHCFLFSSSKLFYYLCL